MRWAAVLLVVGEGLRAVAAAELRTLPFSDFRYLLQFAQAFAAGALPDRDFWSSLGPGLPVLLAPLLRLVPAAPEVVARWATVGVCGAVPAVAFLLLRDVTSLRARLAAGIALALWPGQVLASGILAQDNWVILPTVALACLAARALRLGEAAVAAATICFLLALAIRQEMLVVLAPALAAVVMVARPQRRAALVAVALLAAGLGGLAAARWAATGRFALTSEHAGMAMLGSYVPGAVANGWADPVPEIAALRPEALASAATARAVATGLAWREATARPLFHLLRIASLTTSLAFDGESANLYWTHCDGCVAPPLQARAIAWHQLARPWMLAEAFLVHASFLAAVILALAGRDRLGLLLAGTVALKVALHAVTVQQGRYLLVVTALEVLTVATVWPSVAVAPLRRLAVASGVCLTALALLGKGRLQDAVLGRDVYPPRTYRFDLAGERGVPRLHCTLAAGALVGLTPDYAATFRLRRDAPPPGDGARLVCTAQRTSATAGTSAAAASLRLADGGPTPWVADAVRWRVAAGGITLADGPFGGPGLAAGAVVALPQPVLAGTLPLEVELQATGRDPGTRTGVAALRVALR